MKTVEQLKGEVYYEVQNSGFMKNIQSQVKSHVYDIIEQESRGNKEKLGFKYEHPVLKKMRAYPLTSLCMDLIQEFLESFKFKHTLNVFKKQINRDLKIDRSFLSKQFSVDLSGKDQAALLSIVSQLFNGDIKIIQKTKQDKIIARQGTADTIPRKNNFMNQQSLRSSTNQKSSVDNSNIVKPVQNKKKQPHYFDLSEPPKKQSNSSSISSSKQQQSSSSIINNSNSLTTQKITPDSSSLERQQQQKQEEQRKKQLEKQEEEQKNKKGKKKNKKEEEKPPEEAQDLLKELMEKFAPEKKKEKKPTEKQKYEQKRAFSEQKVKEIKPQEGSNKIRGISMGKILGSASGGSGNMSSFMKFSSFNNQASNKNETHIEQQLDQFQQSNSSLRKNPLYSSNQSGFDKSNGYDQSVDSMAIEDFEYVQKAKKFGKKY